MPRKSTSIYSVAQTQEMTMRALGVLAEQARPLTITEICQGDIALTNATPQKMARCLGELVDMGVIKRSQNKRTKRMMYVSVEALEKQGYDLEDMVY